MAENLDEENEEIEYADFDYDYDEEFDEPPIGPLVGIDDCIVSEIRKNSKFESIFDVVNESKDSVIEARKDKIEDENSDAMSTVISATKEMSKMEVELEELLGKKVNKTENFTLVINGVELTREDLDVLYDDKERYRACLEDKNKMKRDIKKIESEIRKVKLARTLSLSKHSYIADEYQLSCFQVQKTEKLNEDEEYLKKYEFFNSLTVDEYTKLSEVLGRLELVGNSIKTLEKNGRDQKEMESIDGQSKLFRETFERCLNDGTISSEDYDELMSFIKEKRIEVSDREYDASDVTIDTTNLGMMIKGYISELDRKDRDIKRADEMLQEFEEAHFDKEDDEKPDYLEIEETESEKESEIEEARQEKLEIEESEQEALEIAEEPEFSVKEIENDMIVARVLENEKYREIMVAIEKREDEIYVERRMELNHKADGCYKDYRVATRYVNEERAKLGGIFEMPVSVDNDGVYFGNLFITPEDLDLASINEQEYEERLDELKQIKKDQKDINKAIKIGSKGPKYDLIAQLNLRKMNQDKEQIENARKQVEREIKIAEFFENFSEEDVNRIILFVKSVELIKTSQEKIEEVKDQLVELDSDSDEVRKPIMKQALAELVREGVITKAQNQELANYIRKYKKGFEDGTYRIVDKFGRDETVLGQVGYDYIDLIDEILAKIKSKEEKEQEEQEQTSNQTQNGSQKQQDDDGDIEI